MATISYKCDTCKREIELVENKQGFTVVGKCVITEGCLGRLYRTGRNPNNVRESAPSFVEGMANYVPRRALHTHKQPLPSNVWEIEHNMGVLPAVFAYATQTDGKLTLIDNSTYTVEPESKNKLNLKFNTRYTGVAQCVARSTVPIVPNTLPPADSLFQVSSDGIFTIAVPMYIVYTFGPNKGQSFNVCTSNKPVQLEIEVTRPNEESFVCFEDVPNVISNKSPWSTWGEVIVGKRKNYCVRSLEILKMKVFGSANLRAEDIPDGTRIRITRIDYGDGVRRPIHTRSLLSLLSKAPYQQADKIKDQLVDIGEMVGSNPDYFVYMNGEFMVDNSLVETTYPDISRVLHNALPPPPPSPTPSPSITPSVTGTITPTPTPTVTPNPTLTPTPTATMKVTPTATVTVTPTTSVSATPAVTPTMTVTPTITPSVTPSLPLVGIISAGTDTSSLCGNTVPLIGSVLGNNDPSRLSFLWEQIDGPAVVIDDPTSMVTFYTYNQSSDRTFRLWANKGQLNQAYDDVTVYGTPSSGVDLYSNIRNVDAVPPNYDLFVGPISGFEELT